MNVSLHPVTNLVSLLDLEMVKPDAYLGVSPRIGWDRIYGGQVVAQALRAAGLTVAPEYQVHSLHSYFVRPGDETAPVLFEVERVRDGRSFCTRQVIASQAGGVILNLIASFQVNEDGPDVQRVEMPSGLRPPDSLTPATTDLFLEHRVIESTTDSQPRQRSWMRVPHTLGEDPLIHACALAYLSDEDLLGVALLALPIGTNWEQMMAASLDHAVWFHRPVRADEWLLFDLSGQGTANARGLAFAWVFRADGTHVATVAQEGLGRRRR
ncbi:MAG TPA: acyl-CoA thioesterase domain-containing protein [Acidimicrobiia bacterium]|nr:acyl-CoA thioesterase domain-containing protein [Acidimicrobiia bacterium]